MSPPIPTTPKERADNLRALGAVVTKLPSYKRDEYSIQCPRCGAHMVAQSHSFVMLTEDQRSRFHVDKLSLGDVKKPTLQLKPTDPTYYVERGDTRWIRARAHLRACKGARPERGHHLEGTEAVTGPQYLRLFLEDAPEDMKIVALEELAAVLDHFVIGHQGIDDYLFNLRATAATRITG